MRAKSVEELLVYQKALDAAVAVSAILERGGFARDVKLRDQLGASSERAASTIAEGFGQTTDRHFAYYLSLSRAASYEARTQLQVGSARKYITAAECADLCERYDEVARMLTGFIKHLRREDRKRRA